ncbi:hypothetical protein Bca4012_064535 [Brassica carinata]
MGIFDAMKQCKLCVCLCLDASMCVFLLAPGSKENRYCIQQSCNEINLTLGGN